MKRWLGLAALVTIMHVGMWHTLLPQEPSERPSARDLLLDRSRDRGNVPEQEGRSPWELFQQRLRDLEGGSPANPELRNRRIDPNEKMAPANLASFAPIVESHGGSVVRLLDGSGRMRAFGTVVREDGLVISKASELVGLESIQAESAEGKGEAIVVGVNDRFDLALLHVDLDGLKPVQWTDGEPAIGTLLVSPDPEGEPFAVGVVSVAARPLVERGRAFMGVEPITVAQGVQIESVGTGSPADQAGLKIGDIVTRLDGEAIATHHQFANWIRRCRPGEEIVVDFIRGGNELSVTLTLIGVNSPFEMRGSHQEEMGAELSGRMSDFELVFQHDLPLWPEQCGSPVFDLEGRVVGLNIARGGRVRSYAIPSGKVAEIVEQLIETMQVVL
ncbi:MAG: PDZ domain-containing protein [Planctomycetales bacterium]|nr:PDZ domain-containing protein [Planctomycetales bacterium]